jgi:hypothetical protein
MGGFRDLKDQQFGKLKVIELYDRDKHGHCRWLCKCECNGLHSETVVQSSNLIRGLTTSCRKCNSYYEHPDGYMVGVTAKGEEFLFDKEDFDLVKQYVWHISGEDYVVHKDKDSIMMHRLIMSPPSDMDVDHIFGKRKDNRRSELRICTRQQNLHNSKKVIRENTSSKYKGVTFNRGSYFARIRHDGQNKYLGNFKTEKEAALAYNEAAIEFYGEYAKLNVIGEDDIIG